MEIGMKEMVEPIGEHNLGIVGDNWEGRIGGRLSR